LELLLAKERAEHAALRADFLAEQYKAKEIGDRLLKAEKRLKKSQKFAADSKNYNINELHKAHGQIATLRADLAKMAEKLDSERRSHKLGHHSQQLPSSPSQLQQQRQSESLVEQISTFFDSCIPSNLDLLDLNTLVKMHDCNIKASELIAAAKARKIEELAEKMEKLRLELEDKTEQFHEKEESLKCMITKVTQLEKAHSVEKEELKHLVGEGLEEMNSMALEKLEEMHLKGLRDVGAAKTRALSQEISRLQREKDELMDRAVCVVCADSQINTILSPCGHRCMCKGCAGVLSSCPLCRKAITDKLQYFP